MQYELPASAPSHLVSSTLTGTGSGVNLFVVVLVDGS